MPSQPDPQPLRLAILEADTPLPGTRAKYGRYGGVFESSFARAAAPVSLSNLLAISYHDVVGDPENAYPPLADVDAILITGSRHTAYDRAPWIDVLVEYTRAALATTAERGSAGVNAHAVRVVGVCFGHQIVGRALDVPVGPSPMGWEVSVTSIDLTPAGATFFGLADRRAVGHAETGEADADGRDGRDVRRGDGKAKSLQIHQMHRDAVLAVPPGAELLCSTRSCPVQGFLLHGRVVTVQGHPEFTEDIVREILDLRHEIGVLGDETYLGGIERVANKHDGVAIASAFLRFLRQ